MDERRPQVTLARAWWWLPMVGAGVGVLASVAAAHQAGFPLDDSWIHQDFARTLATTGRFAYLPGHSGAGSTSPLWVLLLVPPYLITHGTPPLWLLSAWSAVLGYAALDGVGLVAGWLAFELSGLARATMRVRYLAATIAGLACVVEWHLVWAAASGMETDLFAAVVLCAFLAASRRASPIVLGLLCALALAIRPEGIVAGAVVALGVAWSVVGPPLRLKRAPQAGEVLRADPAMRRLPSARTVQVAAGLRTRLRAYLVGWLAPFLAAAFVGAVPYALVNLAASGHILPSTFYAKSAYFVEGNYAAAVVNDLSGVATTVVGSSPVLLLLGALSYSKRLLAPQSTPAGTLKPGQSEVGSERHSIPLRWMLWLWALTLVFGYAGRGVEVNVHGRYLIPALPALIVLGAAGAAPMLVSSQRRLLAICGGLLLVVAGGFSLVLGALYFGANVHFINATQVATARWLRKATPRDTLIATHDIGAIGYFSGDRVVDIAGLADPELIPVLGDQPALEADLRSHHVAYVAIYTNWFQPPNTLVHDLADQVVFRAPGISSFVVYKTGW